MSSTKRIIDLQTTSSVGSDDYVMLDGATNGTKKYPLKDILDAIEDVEQGTSLAAGAVGTNALAASAVTNAKVATDAVATANIQNGAVTLAKIAAGSDATTAASGLMSSADKTKLNAFEDASHYALKSEIAGAYIYRGSVANESGLPTSNVHVGDVYNIIAASSYGGPGANVAWNGTAWDTLGETFELGDGSVTTAKLDGGAVTAAKLANGSVTTVKLDVGAVTEPKIGTGAVTTSKLGTGVVTAEKINDGAVTTTKLATSSVTTAKIADNSVTADKLTTNAVTTTKIADGNVTAAKLDTNSVTTTKITDGAVTNAKIGSEAVTNGKLATNAVATANIQNGAITTAKLADSAVTTAKLGTGAVTNAKVATDAIATTNIQDDSVTTNKLDDGAVTFDKLDDEIVETLDFKADIDGYYAQMTVGSADNLTARGDAIEAKFLYRTSGGIADIESGNAAIKSIKGNTLVWNQLNNNRILPSSSSGVTIASNGDGSVTISGTSTKDTTVRIGLAPIKANHKYLIKGCPAGGGPSTYDLNISGIGLDYGSGDIASYPSDADNTAVRLHVRNGQTFDNVVMWPQLFDLTTMFGAGNEPSTVAEFEAMYPEPYYPYDAGSLKPVSITGIETTGFNQWDEEWEKGSYDNSTGAPVADTSMIRAKNPIEVFPSTEYYFKAPYNGVLLFYDEADSFIRNDISANANKVFTTPSNCRYMRFRMASNYGTTYKNDICVNLSWSGRRDGEYEEYWKAERAIAASTYFPTGLKKAGAVYDELTATEAIQRVGEVDLGSLTWTYDTTSGATPYFYTTGLNGLAAPPANNDTMPDLLCAKYVTHTATGYSTAGNLITMAAIVGTVRVIVVDSEYTDAATFKTAMSGVMLYYALKTPTITPIDPPLNLTYKVDDWGTERVMVSDGTVSAVPTFDIIYGMNAVDTIRRLPDLYAGKAETEAALDTKANIDGYYQQLTAGAADNLTGRGDATGGEYLFRTTAGTASVSDEGVATVKSIKGRTLKWNQLVDAGTTNRIGYGITMVPNQDESWTVSGTVSESPAQPYLDVSTWTEEKRRQVFIPNHKVLVKVYDTVCAASDRFAYGVFTGGGFGYAEIATSNPRIVTITDVPSGVYLRVVTTAYAGQTISGTVAWQVFDLTQMFGAGNEPSTVAEFNALYPLPYYPYDAGSLLPVNMTGIETTGFNQWDGTWEGGSINGSTGQNQTWNGRSRSFYIPVFPNTEYYHNSTIAVFYYDANKNFLSARPGFLEARTFTTPANCRYIRFMYNAASMPSDTICINLSWSGYRNGEYEPYWSDQRLIPADTYFPDGMHSAGNAYDELTETKAIKRIGAYTFTVDEVPYYNDWQHVVGYYATLFTIGMIPDRKGVAVSKAPNACMVGLDGVSYGALYSTANPVAGFTMSTSEAEQAYSFIIRVPTSIASNNAEIVAWLAGKTLYYELATPVITPIGPPLNLDYRYADFGTERIMVPEGEMSAPPTVEAVYGINATDTIRNLPTDYTSKKSLENLIAALDAHNGTTTTMTWNEGQQAYTFAIADNA